MKTILLFFTLFVSVPFHNAGAQSKGISLNTDMPERFVVPMSYVLRPVPPPRVIDIPNVGEFRVLKGDFHIHTVFSDGDVMPRDRVLEAIDNGLDVIAITDHIEVQNRLGGRGPVKLSEAKNNDYNYSYELAKEEAGRQRLLVIRGAEITKKAFPPGHFVVLFAQDVNPIAAAVDDWRKMVEVAVGQGAFILWAHPGWINPGNGGLERGQPMFFPKEHEELHQKGWLHGMEAFNWSEFSPLVPDWCNEKDLAIFANSDLHASEANWYGFQNPQRPMNLILAKERTVESVKEALFAKRVIGWAAGYLWGRKESVEPLFDACVNIEIATGKVRLTNRSDIPCTISYAGKTYELAIKGTIEFVLDMSQKTFTVANWFVGTDKPLERKIQ
jgi:hypothetical protein